MTFYHEDRQAVLEHLQSDPSCGLTQNQVLEKRANYGENRLSTGKKKTNLQRFLEQFKDVMILILLGAAAVSFLIACIERNPSEFFEPLLILLIVVLNAVIGVMQESKAEQALDALKSMSAPHARVLREGVEQVIGAAELVPGDIIHLEAGNLFLRMPDCSMRPVSRVRSQR